MAKTREQTGKRGGTAGTRSTTAAERGVAAGTRRATAAEKGKGKQGSTSGMTSSEFAPEDFGFSLSSQEAQLRFARLSILPHKACRFLDMPTIIAMGIADNVLALAANAGLTAIFQANYKAYKGITLEFLSTVHVIREAGTPIRMRFQLGGEMRELTDDELNTIMGGSDDGHYVGNHSFNNHEFWGALCWGENNEYHSFNPRAAKASSIRNPAFRYFHRLLSTTFLSRIDDGTCQGYDLHVMWAATKYVTQHVGCYLMDHFANQALLSGGSKISIGAMVTPIAQHFGVEITEQPISEDILLDRRALITRRMIHPDSRRWLWRLYQASGVYVFKLPNTPLTELMGDNAAERWNMSSQEHFALMTRLPEGRQREGRHGEEQEQEEEEEAYEQGGEMPRDEQAAVERGPAVQAPYRMRAPDFEGFEQRFYTHSDAHHNEQMEAHDNYYWQMRQDLEENVGMVRRDVDELRQEVRAVNENVNRVYDAQRAYMEMIEAMHRSWPYFPPQDPPPQ